MASSQRFRLDRGGLIDRARPLEFRFNGQRYQGFEGDSLASALLANGVRVVGRSFKYHRPRGVFSAGEEEPNALVETGTGHARVPNCRAPTIPLREGLISGSQKGWPALGFDLARIIDYTHALWPAGFYNKTFKWPNWHTWEPSIRVSSGLGRAPDGPDPDRYERMNWHCDLLICGGGITGLMAALIAGRSGLKVLIAEQDWEWGGSANSEQIELDERRATQWVTETVTELSSLENVLMLPATTVTGIYDHKVTTMVQTGKGRAWRECYWQVRPESILLATGAIEQGMVFPNNDRPGIMLAGAVRTYLNRYAVVPGEKIVVACNNDSAYQTAFDLAQSGKSVQAVVDERANPAEHLQLILKELGIQLFANTRISNTRGSKGITGVRINSQWVGCDLLAVSGGWAPRVHLASHAGARLRFDSELQCYIPDELPAGIHTTGGANGEYRLEEALTILEATLEAITNSAGRRMVDFVQPHITREPVPCAEPRWQPPVTNPSRQWIDMAHDVTSADAELAVREGFESVEHFKRYTTAGMSVDQGKTSNTNAFLLLSHLTGTDPGSTGTTTFRPPYSPVSAGVIAAQASGELYVPRRHMPAHIVHKSLGAHFEDYGWQRPEYYARAGETSEETITREVNAVRTSVGVFDNSPVGKLEVCGPDAAGFLDRFFINNILGLEPGRARYGLMLNENGVIVDDGVVICLDAEHFIVHTTSGHAVRIREMLEEWHQCEWPGQKVVIHDATTQWANFTIAGPKSRAVLKALDDSLDYSSDAFPHMSAIQAEFCGMNTRISRISYSGELSYEINVPSSHAPSFLEQILEAGQCEGITPFGIEALMVLRTEKGYLHVGSDTDGSTTPDDVGWGEVARRKTRDFIGRRSLFRPANTAPGRKQLVGLVPIDSAEAIPAGGHLVLDQDASLPSSSDGWVTSACYSPSIKSNIALGMLTDGRAQLDKPVRIYDQGQVIDARVVAPVFYDPANERLS